MAFRMMTLALCAMLMACSTVSKTSLPGAESVVYELAPGDRLKLEVFREDTISGEYVINDQGFIGLPMAGEIRAAGKTLGQLRKELTAVLGQKYVRDARVSLEMVAYRPIYILGEVQKPGEYQFAEGMSVYGLVAKAGGFTYRANENVVFIRHDREAEERAYSLTSGAAVLPGDTVRIGARYF
jgi:polysaccharide export outer membrane protein